MMVLDILKIPNVFVHVATFIATSLIFLAYNIIQLALCTWLFLFSSVIVIITMLVVAVTSQTIEFVNDTIYIEVCMFISLYFSQLYLT